MKKLVFVICSALMLAGCLSSATLIPYTSSAPPEKNCTLNIIATLTVTSFDGQKVDWMAGPMDSWASVQIPEGMHTLVFDYERRVGNSRHFRSGIRVSYDKFAAGHMYEMVAAEGAEAGGFSGLFTNPLDAMLDTAHQALRLGIRDITGGQNGDFSWLDLGGYEETR
jgi:hypothetical protein